MQVFNLVQEAQPKNTKSEIASSTIKISEYNIQSILNASSSTTDIFEELKTQTKTGKTTTEENAKANKDYYQRLSALEELTEGAGKPFMYNGDLLRP